MDGHGDRSPIAVRWSGTSSFGPRQPSGNVDSALNVLADRATYVYSGQGKYWDGLQANISRREPW